MSERMRTRIIILIIATVITIVIIIIYFESITILQAGVGNFPQIKPIHKSLFNAHFCFKPSNPMSHFIDFPQIFQPLYCELNPYVPLY